MNASDVIMKATNVNGSIKIWFKEREFKDSKGKTRSFLAASSSIGTKDGDEWVNLYYDVRFSKQAMEKLNVVDGDCINYHVTDGWWTVKKHNDKIMLQMFINNGGVIND